MLSVFGRIFRTTKELWPFYLIVTLAAVSVSLLQLTTPFLVKQATDTIVGHFSGDSTLDEASSVVLWLALTLLAVELSHTVIQNIGGWFGDVMAMRMRQILSNRYFAKLLSLPQSYYDKQVTGTIISRLDRSILGLSDFVKSFANNFISMMFTITLVLIITAIYYWPLAILLAVIFPMYLYLTMLTSKKWMVWEKDKNEHIDTAQGRFAEVIGQMKVVKSFVTELRELRLFQSHFAETISLTKAQSRWWHFMDVLRLGGLNLVFAAIYFTLFWRTLHGHFSIGDMVFLLQLVTMARQPALMMSWMVDTAQRAAAGSREYFMAMDELEESSAPKALLDASRPGGTMLLSSNDANSAPSACPMPQADGSPVLEFDHITFAYTAGEPVIHGVTFQAEANEKVALVGESGGGKSTLVNLLLGLYEPSEGTLRICGRDIATMSAADVRRSVGVVFQEPALFSGTIRENIAYANPGASEEQIIQVAKDAFAHDFIMKFNDGYDTVIGERGLRLSGGQKQRIAVARAMLKDAPILVLDEATSALDTKAERVVQAGLEKLMEGRTTIVIAHRLSTIADVDTIITLDQGHVDEIGSPDVLATSGGIYSELLRLTSSSSAADRKRLKAFGFHVEGDEDDDSE
ncbi:ABC transporter ATP-binding protein [Corynebacterium sp. 320]|uniref:ABC transporter ATP-binding protein n=1 Tax=Corynebacterium TaxID=1716 RepID=UPI00125CCAB9|nr:MULTISPECIES: ABC transporter ATP-binding protein [Corynebacterium]KAB1502404.1 ABC transporter ATP-binding protein [Corynebacterium sp. 320]KAB1551374.1 ABC transporter ATP-binding protein [Corynebacterium sp. 321]KAB1551797.1 ABC transporter ATP-binding protein [Corynebacterium sp. 319]KAB3526011.1 ABC transporter ATP-binding protein [Corynebacterium sp. 250]KAB3538792.1 ABC transporter ATP-binding protein [Corynebacterium sp. 366]